MHLSGFRELVSFLGYYCPQILSRIGILRLESAKVDLQNTIAKEKVFFFPFLFRKKEKKKREGFISRFASKP